MIQGKVYSVGTLGLHDQELRLIKSILKLTTYRPQGSYELNEGADLSDIDVVIINAEDAGAMASWRAMAWKDQEPVPLLITNVALVYSTENYFFRPFNPTKVLALLDNIAVELQIQDPKNKIFAGKNKAEPVSPAQAMGSTQYRRALVVDDSPTVRKQLELELKSYNHHIYVDSAETGEAGLELVAKNYYDIIFLDVVLPGVDGYQVCKVIKKNPEAKQTPVVMLTSKSSPFDRVRGSLAGCDSYLTKPVDYEKFRQVLEVYKV